MVANNKTRIAFAATILSMATTLPGVLSLSPALHHSYSRASGRSTSSRVSMALKGKHKLVFGPGNSLAYITDVKKGENTLLDSKKCTTPSSKTD